MNVFMPLLETPLVSVAAAKDKGRQDYKRCVTSLQAACNPVTRIV